MFAAVLSFLIIKNTGFHEILELSGVCNEQTQKIIFGGCNSKAWENIKQYTFSWLRMCLETIAEKNWLTVFFYVFIEELCNAAAIASVAP